MTDRYYNVDGEIVPAATASVSVRDRGFRYGDGGFETMRVYGGTIFERERHLDRLEGTCRHLGIQHGLDRSTLVERLEATVSANGLSEGALRLAITRGIQPGRLRPDPTVDPTVVVTAGTLPSGGLAGEPPWDDPAMVRITDRQRIPDAAIPSAAKSLNYLNGILARQDAPDSTEALLRDAEGQIAEGATSNVFFVEGGVVYTPSTEGPVLPGITRSVVLESADAAGIPTRTGHYGPDRVRGADEIFLTNTTWELRPVDRIDDRELSIGPVTDRLQALFADRIEAACY